MRPVVAAGAPGLHLLAPGDTVTVLQLGPSRSPLIEGRALIRGSALGRNTYWVQFIDDPVLRVRVVHPDYQRDPERFLTLLRELWAADQALFPNITDFFA